MKDLSPEGYYLDARKLGIKEYNRCVSRGENGYLPSLEGILKNTDIVSEVDLGIVEIPLKQIIGTYSHLRSLSLAKNFMPLLSEDTEFGGKWINLCKAHLNEGIKHSIKIYEYLNWYYVQEGNKRVSVLKYFDAYSITGTVTRFIPKKDKNDYDICLYYEFLKFNKITNLFSIYFSKIENFGKLLKMLDKYNPKRSAVDTKYRHFDIYVYKAFSSIYNSLCDSKLPLTTGDAFLEYAKIYGIPDYLDEKSTIPKVKELITELEHKSYYSGMSVQTVPIEKPSSTTSSVISALTSLVLPKKKKLKAAFAYARTIDSSGWTYAHEIGRQYVSKLLEDQVETNFIENVPENTSGAYQVLRDLVRQGNNVIFTTSPIFNKATLKCAMDYPNIRFFNCSEYQPYVHVGNYFGRTYEPRFLTGIIAGSMTKTNILGYVATTPDPEVVSSINAFTLGAKMVNPYVKVKVSWTNEWNSDMKNTNAAKELIDAGSDIISNQAVLTPHPVTYQYGVYSMLSSIDLSTGLPDKYLAAPIWNWGIFYEKILKSILNDTLKTIHDMYGNQYQMLNFWWGIASGVLDIYYSKEHVPKATQKLVDVMRKMIIESVLYPFTGPINDSKGMLRFDKDAIATHEQILAMDWFVEDVES
ncbi:BMP family ABC transporter substrate-binding protein [Clostridium oryzae]|uniref:Purine-binding protein n=1 Tax=Clostridium oryzae TaxID=1450648 RepID=A0A1V4IPC1_9CLOT|nr:BMP family ABC transporter substrate-binding protein [Clostridium oryzae]OPJ61645.1 purine-binding protein precursor [Clostridium oryzae]